ncbi:hypothetical protein ACFY3J_18405 [Streptomyces sp. NPDC001231]|uniref:hypothetical protein n=1 Tax=Streptomyces sp. NPDC001231 TaxID=3364549 RepID=UPI00367FF52F
MKVYMAVPGVLIALLFAASGVAGIARGWVPPRLPTNRRPVHRPRLYGWGQLVYAFGMFWYVVFWLVLTDPGIRPWGALFSGALGLTGITLMMMGQYRGRNRQGGGTVSSGVGSARREGP